MMTTKKKIEFYAAVNDFLKEHLLIVPQYDVVDRSFFDLTIKFKKTNIPMSMILGLHTLYSNHNIGSMISCVDDYMFISFYSIS